MSAFSQLHQHHRHESPMECICYADPILPEDLDAAFVDCFSEDPKTMPTWLGMDTDDVPMQTGSASRSMKIIRAAT